VVIVSEAVVSLNAGDAATIATFTDLPQATAESALKLSADMGLLAENGGQFTAASPLSKLLRSPQEREKAAILRVALESYVPFQVFREEHAATANVTDAAQRTKVKLDLDCHREECKRSLATTVASA